MLLFLVCAWWKALTYFVETHTCTIIPPIFSCLSGASGSESLSPKMAPKVASVSHWHKPETFPLLLREISSSRTFKIQKLGSDTCRTVVTFYDKLGKVPNSTIQHVQLKNTCWQLGRAGWTGCDFIRPSSWWYVDDQIMEVVCSTPSPNTLSLTLGPSRCHLMDVSEGPSDWLHYL